MDRENRLVQLLRASGEDKKEYLYASDFYDDLNIKPDILKEKTITVGGTGKLAAEFMQWNATYPVQFFIDSYSEQKEFCVKEVVRLEYESSDVSNLRCRRLLSNGTLFTPKRWQRFKQEKKGKFGQPSQVMHQQRKHMRDSEG